MDRVSRAVFAGASLIVAAFVNHAEAQQFDGRVVVEWLEQPGADRDMRLLEEITFTDRQGVRWTVPAGAVIDGASIPRLFWDSVGPPFVGDYRRASVIHDYYCDAKAKDWRATHRLFYHAAIAGGVPRAMAQVMYAAIYVGGPRWEVVTITGMEGPESRLVPISAPGANEEEFARIRGALEVSELTLDQIEHLVEAEIEE